MRPISPISTRGIPMTKLLELGERVEQATGPEYSLDCAIWDAIYPGERDARFKALCEDSPYRGRLGPADKDGYIKPLRAFTASIDAAATLVPKGWGWSVDSIGLAKTCPDHDGMHPVIEASAATPALALT